MILLRDLPQILCPNCVRQGGVAIFQHWQARPIGSWSLVGVQLKMLMREVLVLDCNRCDWFVLGHREGDHAVFPDPHVVPDHPQYGQETQP